MGSLGTREVSLLNFEKESGAPALGIIVRVYGKNSSKYYVAELDSLVIGDIFFFPMNEGRI